ncbi:hypothetical protein [Clostridium sp. YIM B02555]|uniref:hypothetical protein n=1 Tax=Clostridium sp. YIM B02555 TaxID=2911968 RepID=UPI001EEDC45D|nr:hypothetical protein [Clostridium sp. YIM B02555]
MASFDTPQSTTLASIHVTGTIPAANDAGYIEIRAIASRAGAKQTFYQAFSVTASPTGPQRAWAGNGTYQIVIYPKLTSTQSVTSTSVLSSFQQ